MKTIYKYPIKLASTQEVAMLQGAKILCVQIQSQTPCLWAEVNADTAVLEHRSIEIFGTGQLIPSDMLRDYIGTVQTHDGQFVWHVYEYRG